MALVTESFIADGTQRNFQVASTILSESHLRVHYYYNGLDNPVSGDEWDLLSDTVLFNVAPTSGYVVKITVSSDGYGLEDSPTNISKVADNINSIITTAQSIGSVNTVASKISYVETTANNIANVVIVAADINSVNIVAVDIASIKTVSGSITKVNTVSDSITSVNTVSSNIASVNTASTDIANINIAATNIININSVATDIANINIAATNIININSVATTIVPNIAEILLADTNAVIATTKASEAYMSESNALIYKDIATTKANEASISEANAMTYKNIADARATNASDAAANAFTYRNTAFTSSTKTLAYKNTTELLKNEVEAIYLLSSTGYHSGEYVFVDSITPEDLESIVVISHFSIEDGVAERTDLAVSSGAIDCGGL